MNVPKGFVAKNIEEALSAIDKLKTDNLIVKAQIHAGGRGKARGILAVKGREELKKASLELLHKNLITSQTTRTGLPVNHLLIEEKLEIDNEMYLSMFIDTHLHRIAIMASREGGINIEQLVKKYPDKIICRTCVTGQHRQMLDQFLRLFDIKPDYDLDIMEENQDLGYVASSVLIKLRDILRLEKPDYVLVQGELSWPDPRPTSSPGWILGLQ